MIGGGALAWRQLSLLETFLKTGSYIAQTGLELAVEFKMTLGYAKSHSLCGALIKPSTSDYSRTLPIEACP